MERIKYNLLSFLSIFALFINTASPFLYFAPYGVYAEDQVITEPTVGENTTEKNESDETEELGEIDESEESVESEGPDQSDESVSDEETNEPNTVESNDESNTPEEETTEPTNEEPIVNTEENPQEELNETTNTDIDQETEENTNSSDTTQNNEDTETTLDNEGSDTTNDNVIEDENANSEESTDEQKSKKGKKSDESNLENTLGASSLATFVSQTEPITINDKCMEDLYGKDLVCEAKDVSIANVTDIEFIDNDTCDSPEDTVKFRAKWEVQPTSTKKYNIGLYFPTEGQSNALNGYYSITSLPNDPVPPWYNFDDNICGDISSDGPVFPVIELEVKCLDPDGDNVLNLPYCTSWEQNSSACSGPLNTIPGAPSKCNCNDGFEVPITVPYKANIEVIKDLNPSTDLGEFKLNLNGNGITEETSCVGDAGTTGKITVGAGTSKNPGATYTIGEKACDGTNISSYSTSISCVSRSTGNLVATGTGTSLQLTVNKDDDVVCTITNDQKTANITVIKEIINDNGGKKGLTDFGITFSGGDLTFDSGVTVGDKTTYTSKPINVTDLANPYTLYELDLSDYDESDWSCGETVREENEVQTSFSFKPGENKTCKITNNDKPAKLIVKKVRVGHDTPYENFAFSVNQASEIVFEQDGQNDLVLNAGTYNVTETTTSSDYIVTYDNCTNLNITNGETETCTITNTKKGTIIVEKEVLPNDSKQTFSFSGDLNGTI